MNKVRILHISDLHFKQEQEINRKRIYEAFFNDLEKMNKEKKVDFIIFSGDLIYDGKKENFKLVKELFVDKLLNSLKLEKNFFLFCPGNHDINREYINKDLEESLRKNLLELKNRDDLIENKNHIRQHIYVERIREFYEFKKEFISEKSENFNIYSSSHKIEEFGIGVVCINSSIISNGNDKGKLVIGRRQIEEMYEDIKDCNLKILVVHHPIDYLIEEERMEIKRLIVEKFDLLCSGHTHEEEIESISVIDEKNIIKSIAGGLYLGYDTHWKGKNYSQGYSILDIENDECEIIFRKYYDKRSCFDCNIDIISEGKLRKKILKSDKKFTKINLNILEETKTIINKKLLSFVSDCNAPKNIEEIFVAPLLTLNSETKDLYSKKNSKEKIELENILNNNNNYVIFGKKESGKTTLLNYMIIRILKSYPLDEKIPIFIRFNEFINSKSLDKLILEYIQNLGNDVNTLNDVRSLLEKGKFIIFIDDLDLKKDKLIENMNQNIEKNNNNKFILAVQDKYSDSDVSLEVDKGKLNFEKIFININSFRKKEAKELIKKWKNEENIDNSQLDIIIRNIEKMGIPMTPHILSLLFWIKEKTTEYNPVNKAAILEKFFDIILEKLDDKNNYYIINDYNDKIHYLTWIAGEMESQNKNYFTLREIEKLTNQYLEAFCLETSRVSEIIDYFLKKGVFLEKDNKILFKYKSFYEFFIAKKMEQDEKFREKIISEDSYFKYPNEIEYYSGIKRGDQYLLRDLKIYLEKIIKTLKLVNIKEFDIPYKKTLIKTEKILKKVREENSNKSYEEEEFQIEQKENENIIAEKKEGIDNAFWQYAITLKLLSNTFRNLSQISDLDLRKEVLSKIIENHAQITIEFLSRIEHIKKLNLFSDIRESPLGENILVLILSGIMTEILKEDLYSEKLQRLLNVKLEELRGREKTKEVQLQFFLINCLYLDSYYSDSLNIIQEYIKNERSPLFLDIIQLKLYNYLRVNVCTNEKVIKIQSILKEIESKYIKNSNRYLEERQISAVDNKINLEIRKILNEKEKI